MRLTTKYTNVNICQLILVTVHTKFGNHPWLSIIVSTPKWLATRRLLQERPQETVLLGLNCADAKGTSPSFHPCRYPCRRVMQRFDILCTTKVWSRCLLRPSVLWSIQQLLRSKIHEGIKESLEKKTLCKKKFRILQILALSCLILP